MEFASGNFGAVRIEGNGAVGWGESFETHHLPLSMVGLVELDPPYRSGNLGN
jgi:hypothetical protein